MKKYINCLIVAVMSLSLASCSQDFLDIEQQGVLSTANTYTTADDQTTESFISSVYNLIYGTNPFEGLTQYTNWAILEIISDNSINGDKVGDSATAWDPMQEYRATSENTNYQSFWSYYYTVCYWCNMIIDKLPENQVVSASVKNQVIAEARVLRSWAMMYLVQLFGDAPLADHIMTGEEGNTPASESWKFITDELLDVAQSGALPTKSGLGGQKAIGGRLTTEAAYAILGKAYLWQNDYSNAAKYLYKVIESNKYRLVDDFEALNHTSTDYCDENIWEFNVYDSDYNTSQPGNITTILTSWHCSYVVTPDQFEYRGGWGYGSSPSGEFGEFMEKHDMVDGRQTSRFRGTLVTYEDLFDTSRFSYDNSINGMGIFNPPLNNNQGYLKIKHEPYVAEMVSGATNQMDSRSAKNLCFLRYAEVLLNYAEAVAMGGQAGSAMSGLEALNLVRRRAGLSDAPALDMNNETYGVKAEKRAELFDEGERFIDLVRWGDASTVLKDKGKTRYYFYGYQNGERSAAQSKAQWKIESTATDSKGWQDKYKLFPIPYIEILNNQNLTQNPGW